ncbi:tubulin specific chaperone C [Trichuris trichiura]|uniref:Tubulin specific chaperone C n=1 Tax=Trichuris trichiura TaxID=36087 RepID=A0A077Z5U5_TRITR|nr:tubulin specific chaperone C [Trichuris trichiura]
MPLFQNDMSVKSSEEESFQKRFYHAREQLVNDIEQAINDKCAQDEAFLADVQRRLQDLRLLLKEEMLVIPKYELAKAQKALTDVEDLIRCSVLKVNKLVFNAGRVDQVQQKPKNDVEPKESDEADQVAPAKRPLNTGGPACLSDRSKEEFLLENLKINHVMKLTRLSQCYVRLVSVVGAANLKDLTDCTIVCCPVASSVYVANCERCTFVVACQQLRIHNSTNCKFYAHVTTCGTVENCSMIGMAPYEKERFEQAGLKMQVNNWNDVKDFNHPFCVGQSPSWFIIDESTREKFDLD